MSEHQYYEFQAIDRPLGRDDQAALRDISSRAQITASSFTNSYKWGDLRADPTELMRRWFDLHLYLANWGTRRLMIRLPVRLVDRRKIDDVVRQVSCAELLEAGENLILDITRNEIEDDRENGPGWLAALAPLRSDLLHGDTRLLYLLWLTEAEYEEMPAETPEPDPGLGPLTASLEAFAEFFAIDPDLIAAAAERPGVASTDPPDRDAVAAAIAALSAPEKTQLLLRAFDGDPHVGTELRAMLRPRRAPAEATPLPPRTAGELRARTDAIRLARAEADAAREEAERRRQAEAEAEARRARLGALAQRGRFAWNDVEAEIARRNAQGYDVAAALLTDLRALAEERGDLPDFAARLRTIREQHARKGRFIARLAGLG